MREFVKPLVFIFFGVAFVTVFAQLSYDVPWSDTTIPISGQTLAVLTTGMLLRERWGTLAILIYLLIGGLGLPVFADGGSGWETFKSGSGGFLIGFVVAAFYVGRLASRGWGKTLSKVLEAMLLGTLIIMGFGVAYLTTKYGFSKALQYGCYPFIPGAVLKILLGAAIVWAVENRKGALQN